MKNFANYVLCLTLLVVFIIGCGVHCSAQGKDTTKAVIFTQMPLEKSAVQYNGYVVIKNKDTTFLNQDKKRISSQIVQYYSINNKIVWVRKQH